MEEVARSKREHFNKMVAEMDVLLLICAPLGAAIAVLTLSTNSFDSDGIAQGRKVRDSLEDAENKLKTP
ncbi:hypothetical protein ACFQIA_23845 [Halalkalicoccus sp. GCM10025704]